VFCYEVVDDPDSTGVFWSVFVEGHSRFRVTGAIIMRCESVIVQLLILRGLKSLEAGPRGDEFIVCEQSY
jgi:hypothetical protein